MSHCKRCGNCCHLTREWIDEKIVNSEPCPFLAYQEGIATCTIYKKRPFICRYYFCEEQPLTPGKKWNSKGLRADLKKLKGEI